MKIFHLIFLSGLLIVYCFVFTYQDDEGGKKDNTLEFALPVDFQTIAAGYTKQLAAEILFIKTSVYIGGLRPDIPSKIYEHALSNNLTVTTSLYPWFIDPYFFCEAFLPSISSNAATNANNILKTGIEAHPDNFNLYFFHAINYILYLNEPLKSAEEFKETSKIPGAPPIFGHLTAIFSAQGGDLTAGLISLKALLASEKNEIIRAQYKKEIAIFEQALEVNDALVAYQKKYSTAPDKLQQLVPEFIPAIPDIKDSFVLVYDKPTLRLERPDPIK